MVFLPGMLRIHRWLASYNIHVTAKNQIPWLDRRPGAPLFLQSRISVTTRRLQKPQNSLAGVNHSMAHFALFVAFEVFAVRPS